MKKEEKVQTVPDDQKIELTRALPDGTKTLILDFDNVSGYTLLRCEKAAKKEDASIVVPALSQVYQAHVAAIAANVKYDDILALTAKDFTAVMIKTQGFLLGTASQDQTED
ncbi:hypothetical protein SAMN02910401_00339 [Megasphaera elsdenii]|uniref:hypothetical protein n=1 Tax=Megasphaera TaxID=906 RepID=UPI0008F21C43|nr:MULTISPECIES: hypothetical protein [Megasphaera]MCQ4113707.1 hypothetical protein [Megasphaera sp. SC8-1]SFH78840.1 hypothetical protein SAMN02910401_00339 [Megasphaera elsdenii]